MSNERLYSRFNEGAQSAGAYAQNSAQPDLAATGTQYANPSGRITTYVENGTRKQGTSYWDQRQASIDEAYQAQREQNQRALQLAQERAQAATQAQQEALTRSYQGTNRQLYRDYMMQQKSLPQQMAARGYTGGLTESSMLRLGNAYGEALNSNEQARIGQQASYDQALQQQLYEAQAAADAADSQALQNYYSQRDQLASQQRADLEQRAATMAALGDFSLYRKLGYTDSQIRRMKKEWQKMNRKSTGGGGGSRTKTRSGSDGGTGGDAGGTDADTGSTGNRRSYYTGRDGAIGQYTDTGTGNRNRNGSKKPSRKTDTSYADAIIAAQARGAWNGFA